MIREITEHDIGPLVQYGKFFWSKTPYVTTGMEYNPGHVAEMLNTIAEEHYLRVYEVDGEIVGFIGFYIVPFPFNPNYTQAHEIFFFVHPGHRGSIGKELLAQAESDLADKADLVTLGDMMSSTDMNDYYTRAGYQLTERSYTKVI